MSFYNAGKNNYYALRFTAEEILGFHDAATIRSYYMRNHEWECGHLDEMVKCRIDAAPEQKRAQEEDERVIAALTARTMRLSALSAQQSLLKGKAGELSLTTCWIEALLCGLDDVWTSVGHPGA
jgi:hypothetical protein